MSEIVRHRDYKCQSGETFRLKKWSAAKLFSIVSDFGHVLEDALDGINTTTIGEIQLISRLVVSISQAERRLIRIIKESVENPKLSDDQIKDLDPEDVIGVLAEILEMNLTEGLSKNFQRLLGIASPGARKLQTSATSGG